MKRLFPLFSLTLILLIGSKNLEAQCCGVGGGNPMAGDASRGVLIKGQTELSTYYQLTRSDKFLNGNKTDTGFITRFTSDYIYTRAAFGFTSEVTLGIEFGYWINKTQHGSRGWDTYSSGGIGDVLLFPRFSVLKPSNKNRFHELTIGLGFKMPLGSYNDSIGLLEPFSGETFYKIMPPAVQASTGANDLFFNLFWSKLLTPGGLRLTANAVYILKGWNPSGEKMGDYLSIGLFGSQQFGASWFGSLQLRYEWIDRMKINRNIYMVQFPDYDPEATGSRKFFVAPQMSYTPLERITLFIQAEYPIMQYVNKTQLASQHQWVVGLVLRHMKKEKGVINPTRKLEQ